jgi:PelA/Pel-15E family pectate lyase
MCKSVIPTQTRSSQALHHPLVEISMTVKAIAAVFLLASIWVVPIATAGTVKWSAQALEQTPEWYGSKDGRAAADAVISYQSQNGAWPKNTDLFAPASRDRLSELQKSGNANTIDNGATTTPIRFLALVAAATKEPRYRDAVLRGVDYLLAAQYPNGGFPQFFPLRQGYYSHITFNDDAMVNALEVLRDTAEAKAPLEFVDSARRDKAQKAVDRGIDVILKTQFRQDGKLTAWCAQYDEHTLAPAWARAYEPPSLSGSESVGIVRFLMKIDKQTPQTEEAIESAVSWLRAVAIKGQRLNAVRRDDGRMDRTLVADASAPLLWARFYELETNRPLYMDRDSQPKYEFSEIGIERRSGYHYHGVWAETLLDQDYPAWRTRITESKQVSVRATANTDVT